MSFNGKKLINHFGEEVEAKATVDAADLVLCYFSAHWCPPCRSFTPVLKDFHEKQKKDGKNVLIIFVSSDQDASQMMSYFAEHGDYFAVPFADKELSQKLKTECKVSGIPSLCLVDKDGMCKYQNCRGDVTSKAVDVCVSEWKLLMEM